MATAGGLHIDTVGSSRQCLLKIPVFFPFKKYKIYVLQFFSVWLFHVNTVVHFYLML